MTTPESGARTQRILGLWGLVALGVTSNLAVLGIIIVTVTPHSENVQTTDALTALSAVAAAGIGALAGWLARGQLVAPETLTPAIAPEIMLDNPRQGDTLMVEARPDRTIRPPEVP